jgi:hypothetical protein
VFFLICRENFKFHYNRIRIKGILHEDQCTFFITSSPFLLRMKDVSDKSVEKIATLITCSRTFSENRELRHPRCASTN